MNRRDILISIVLIGTAICAVGCGDEDTAAPPGGNSGVPTITGVLPPGAGEGIQIEISGSNFGTDQGNGTVRVGGEDAAVTSWSATEIEVIMPAGLNDGASEDVSLTTDSGESASLAMAITSPNTYQVTVDQGQNEYPCWSPDGEWIYFSSARDGNGWDIYRIPSKGGVPERITYDDAPDFWPDVNPNSGELAWSSSMKHSGNTDGDLEIFHGFPECPKPGSVCTVTMMTDNESRDLYPSYANVVYSGYSMVYTWEQVDGGGAFLAWQIMLHSASGPVFLTYGQQPSFSSHGEWVVYTHQVNLEDNIYKISTDGGSPIQLTDWDHDTYPHWGWAKDKIVFERNTLTTNFQDIYIMNPDGTDVQPLISTWRDEHRPICSPDGSMVAYDAWASGRHDIYVYVAP